MKRVKSGKAKQAVSAVDGLKLDLGCGINLREGFTGVDRVKFDTVTYVVDLTKTPWPWADNSVEEVNASHFIEHLTAPQRIAFCNELYRVLKPGGKCQIVVPHWNSCRAYGDLTHQWPPVSEFWFFYLSKDWRLQQVPYADAKYDESGYRCDFDATWAYSMRPDLATRSQEYQQFALANYKEVIMDLVATLTKK